MGDRAIGRRLLPFLAAAVFASMDDGMGVRVNTPATRVKASKPKKAARKRAQSARRKNR